MLFYFASGISGNAATLGEKPAGFNICNDLRNFNIVLHLSGNLFVKLYKLELYLFMEEANQFNGFRKTGNTEEGKAQ